MSAESAPSSQPETSGPGAPAPALSESLKQSFDEHQREIQRRASLSRIGDLNAETFEHVNGDSVGLPFVRADQQFVVFSLSHVHIPPRAVDANCPAVCIYGAFATNEEATEHAQMVHGAHPTMSVFVDRTHAWIVAPQSIDRMTDPMAMEAHRGTLLQQEADRRAEETREFVENVKQARTGKMEAIEEVEENIVAPKAKTKANRVSRAVEVRDQALVAVSFVCDRASEVPEFLFRVYGCVGDESTADRWVRNACGDAVKDVHIDVVSTCEWLFPQQMSSKTVSAEFFRSTELTHLMRNHKQQPQEVQRFYDTYGKDAATDIVAGGAADATGADKIA
jgi:hypothetical protein